MPNKVFVSENGVTISQLISVMKYHLDNFNDESVEINNNTLHKSVLSDSDGLTNSTSSKNMYKGIIRWTLSKNGHEDKAWPNNWIELSVKELAEKII